jgi:hypothetical protein
MSKITESLAVPTTSRMGPLANFLLYQLTWFACVMGAAEGLPWVGVVVGLLVVGLHLGLAHTPRTELVIIGLTGLIGGIWETFIVRQGWVEYQGQFGGQFPPLWIIALWMAFATTFNVSLRWLQRRYLSAALFGLMGGPLAWYAGMRLSALRLPELQTDLTAIGLGWAVLMPLLLFLTRWANGRTAQNPTEKRDV